MVPWRVRRGGRGHDAWIAVLILAMLTACFLLTCLGGLIK